VGALYSPATGIVDFAAVAAAMAEEVRRAGGEIRLNSGVVGIARWNDRFYVQTTREEVSVQTLINCAGLHADKVAQLAGLRPSVHIVPFRGEYYVLRPERRYLVRNLIYPVPDPSFPFLGVHFTRTVDGEVEAGPNAVLAFAREGYSLGRIDPADLLDMVRFRGFWAMARRYWASGLAEVARSLSKRVFLAALRRLIPDLGDDDVGRDGAGVRAQAVSREGTLLDDFHILEAPGAIHVLNAPSPAATASLAIGEHIANLAAASFQLSPRP
jgi:L-2-hydroxyglutarate oxidase